MNSESDGEWNLALSELTPPISSIFFEFGLLKILKGEYIIKNIHIIDGNLNIFIDNDGRSNYNIWEPGDKKSASASSIDLQSMILTDINLRIISLKDKYDLVAFGKKTIIKGSLSNSLNSLLTKGIFYIRSFTLENKKIFKQKAFNFEADLLYQNNNYKIRKGKVKLGSLNFNINGDIAKGYPKNINLKISDGKVKLSELLLLLQNHLKVFLNTFSIFSAAVFAKLVGYASG